MSKPKQYNITPAKGQALLNFQGRRFPDKIDLYETAMIEEIKQSGKTEQKSLLEKKQAELNADFKNLLIQGDCLSACAYLKSQNIKVDLVYIDPPFASGANYAKQIFLRNGEKDRFENENTSIGEEVMYGDIWQKEDYLNWLYERLLGIRDIMSEAGSIYLHLDWHIGHYAKLLMDEVFGEENFKSEIIWQKIRASKGQAEKYGNVHDVIFYYTLFSDNYIFNKPYLPHDEARLKTHYNNFDEKKQKYYQLADFTQTGQGEAKNFGTYGVLEPPAGKHWIWSQEKIDIGLKNDIIIFTSGGKPRVKRYLDDSLGTPVDDIWVDIYPLNSQSDERVDYETQKPETLLERVIKASSNEAMIVADFFSGSGVTAKVANDLGRKFIACDIGINAIQTTRDRLFGAGAEFDILKVNDGLRLFRNPAQTTARIFGIIDGFKTRTELNLSDFWDGGIAQSGGFYSPVKFIGIHEKLSKEFLDFVNQEIITLEDTGDNTKEIILLYAHKDIEITQEYVNKEVAQRSTLKIKLKSLDELLGEKQESLFMPDNADIEIKKEGSKFKIEIKHFFSPYLKQKIDDFNQTKVKNVLEGTDEKLSKGIKISESGLELIEAVQFDTTLKEGIWTSNVSLEDKAKVKEKIKGVYSLDTNKFKIKIRNIAGDEIIIDSEEIK